MKKWIEKQKNTLILFGITSVVLLVMTIIQLNYILQPSVIEDLNVYIETNEIAPSLMRHVVMTVINIFIFIIWLTLFSIILWKIIFPTKKSVNEAFQVDSIKYLYNLPNEIKKELKRDEQ